MLLHNQPAIAVWGYEKLGLSVPSTMLIAFQPKLAAFEVVREPLQVGLPDQASMAVMSPPT
jgi:hypothetical protein